MDDLGNNTLLDVVVRYINEEGNEEKAIVTIDENGVVHVKPFSESEPCDCPTNPKETDSGSISPVTKDPLEQLAEQIQKVLTELSTPQ